MQHLQKEKSYELKGLVVRIEINQKCLSIPQLLQQILNFVQRSPEKTKRNLWLCRPSRQRPPQKLSSRSLQILNFIIFKRVFITSYLWDRVWLVLWLQVDFERVLVARYVRTKLTTFFGSDATFVLQVTKEITTVIIGLKTLRALEGFLIRWSFLWICKRKRFRLVWKVKIQSVSISHETRLRKKEKHKNLFSEHSFEIFINIFFSRLITGSCLVMALDVIMQQIATRTFVLTVRTSKLNALVILSLMPRQARLVLVLSRALVASEESFLLLDQGGSREPRLFELKVLLLDKDAWKWACKDSQFTRASDLRVTSARQAITWTVTN